MCEPDIFLNLSGPRFSHLYIRITRATFVKVSGKVGWLLAGTPKKPKEKENLSLLPPSPSLSIIQSRYTQLRKGEERFGHKPSHKENKCNMLSNGFSRSHVWMWELDHKKGWVPKNWCFRTAVLEKTLESPLDSKEIKLVNPKGNQLWIFTGRTGVEAEAPIFWPPVSKNWLIGKDRDAGKD